MVYFGRKKEPNSMDEKIPGDHRPKSPRRGPANSEQHLDSLLREWAFDPMSLSVRMVAAADSRPVIQMRIDLGVLQMETQGRPDGTTPGGFKTFLDLLLDAERADSEFEMDEEQCFEADREFVQYYHRRISWLRLQRYRRAVEDADHTLALMDVCRDHSPDEEWTISHEQYRPFVLFHRTQAAALAALEEDGAEKAVAQIDEGLRQIREVFADNDAEDQFDEDEMVERLNELKDSLRKEYDAHDSLRERLAQAVASEEYELAAQLRDEIARRTEN
jgi:hypothetical protein